MAVKTIQRGQSWLVFVLTIASAFLAFQITKTSRVQSDWSQDQIFQLSSEMESLLERIDQSDVNVTITAFTSQEGRKDSVFRNQRVEDILSQIEKRSKSISWNMVDYDGDRTTAVQLGVKSYGTIVVASNDKRVDIPERKIFHKQYGDTNFEFLGESVLVEAIREVCFSVDKQMAVVVGHGERSLFLDGNVGFTGLNSLFKNQGYEVKNVNLLNAPKLSDELDLLLLPEPQTPLTILEQESIINFVQGGGSVWIANVDSVPLVAKYLQITTQQGVVAGPSAQFPFWDRPIVKLNQNSVMGWMTTEQISVVLMRGNVLQLASNSTNFQQTSWIRIPKGSWLERGESLEGMPTFDPDVDWKGDASLMAGIQIEENSIQSRVVVMQDIDWLQNSVVESIPANAVLGAQIIEWLSDSEKLSKEGRRLSQPLLITKPQFTSIRWAVMLPVPLFITILGLLAWRKRDGSA